MANVKNDEEECALHSSKRELDASLVDAAHESKKPKTVVEMPVAVGEEVTSEAQEDGDGDAEVDRKGKGFMTRDDKGKGKMVEEEQEEEDDSDVVEEDDDDSSDDDYDSSDGDDSDLSDDPLAEVDLDNILPCRTRRRAMNSGISLGKTEEASTGKDN
uniref:Histone chaperone domain-containing protein n=1 Tax=Kalanchoe fedtschenkoi TaxID=63787 RepID=A0A7N0T560_KALFE